MQLRPSKPQLRYYRIALVALVICAYLSGTSVAAEVPLSHCPLRVGSVAISEQSNVEGTSRETDSASTILLADRLALYRARIAFAFEGGTHIFATDIDARHPAIFIGPPNASFGFGFSPDTFGPLSDAWVVSVQIGARALQCSRRTKLHIRFRSGSGEDLESAEYDKLFSAYLRHLSGR
jgi:hypothetical protein